MRFAAQRLCALFGFLLGVALLDRIRSLIGAVKERDAQKETEKRA